MLHVFNVVWHWFEVKSGTVNESGPYYGFFSGFGSDLGELTIFAAVVGAYRHVNCHIKGCPRFAHHEYEMNGVKYKLCRKHHPAVSEDSRPTAEDFLAHHSGKNRKTPARKIDSGIEKTTGLGPQGRKA